MQLSQFYCSACSTIYDLLFRLQPKSSIQAGTCWEKPTKATQILILRLEFVELYRLFAKLIPHAGVARSINSDWGIASELRILWRASFNRIVDWLSDSSSSNGIHQTFSPHIKKCLAESGSVLASAFPRSNKATLLRKHSLTTQMKIFTKMMIKCFVHQIPTLELQKEENPARKLIQWCDENRILNMLSEAT